MIALKLNASEHEKLWDALQEKFSDNNFEDKELGNLLDKISEYYYKRNKVDQ